MAVDALSQILDALRLRGAIYFHTHLTPPFGIAVPAYGQVARFHMAMKGHCTVAIEGVADPVGLATGDLLVIPHGAAHVIADAPGRPADALDEVLERSGYAGRGALVHGGPDEDSPCRLFCGHFEFDTGAIHPLLTSLPKAIHLPAARTLKAEGLDAVMRFVGAEALGDKPGGSAIVRRLTEILFIEVVRAFVERAGDAAGCLAAVLDPKLSRALSVVHADPARPWTVEAMAAEAGMSRTVFAERFARLIGLTPLAYVTAWRMQIARRALAETRLATIEIAEAAGYASEAAFTRAFKRSVGLTPGEVRRRAIASGG